MPTRFVSDRVPPISDPIHLAMQFGRASQPGLALGEQLTAAARAREHDRIAREELMYA